VFCTCFFIPPSYFALFRSAILEGGAPLENSKMENPPPSFLEEGAPFKNGRPKRNRSREKRNALFLCNGWIKFIKRRTSEKEIYFSLRSTVILFILLSISGDTKKSKDVFFSIFFGRLPGNRWLYHLTRHQTTLNKLNY
jgi:hypothetical protein